MPPPHISWHSLSQQTFSFIPQSWIGTRSPVYVEFLKFKTSQTHTTHTWRSDGVDKEGRTVGSVVDEGECWSGVWWSWCWWAWTRTSLRNLGIVLSGLFLLKLPRCTHFKACPRSVTSVRSLKTSSWSTSHVATHFFLAGFPFTSFLLTSTVECNILTREAPNDPTRGLLSGCRVTWGPES